MTAGAYAETKEKKRTAVSAGCPEGSITIFLSLLLILMLAAMFTFLEAARVWGLDKKSETDAIQTSNSLLAEYQTDLWEDYGLLFLDGCYGTDTFAVSSLGERAAVFSARNLDIHAFDSVLTDISSWNLLGMEVYETEILNYELATDNDGAAFCQEAAARMESEISLSAVKSIYSYIIGSSGEEEEEETVEVEETDMQVILTENPLDVIADLKEGGILGVVLSGESVSDKEIDLSESLAERSLQSGTFDTAEWSGNWTERILFHEYLLTYYDNCTDEEEGKVLDYEIEYLIAGKSSDKANLKAVVNRLIALREAVNLAYLQTDSEKQETALAAAAFLCTAALSPELIPAVKQSLLAAWAYAESLSDVRLLLQGEKVALAKTSDQWNTDLLNLSSTITDTDSGQNSGLTYEQYLHLLLWAADDADLAYRAMDLIEQNAGIRMDTQIAAFSGSCVYTASPLFSAFVSIGDGNPGTYYFSTSVSGTYLAD